MNPNSTIKENYKGLVASENDLSQESMSFKICIANTAQLREEVFRIRYQVYCEELGYEPLSKFPEQLERDAYDPRSVHCLLKHKSSGTYVGCVRLVLSDPHNREARFPFENVCREHLIDFNTMPRTHFGEISRLAVIPRFRNWPREDQTSADLIRQGEQNQKYLQQSLFPFVALNLYITSISLLVKHQLNFGFCLMEAKLARHLRRIGITSRPLGQAVDFNGKRAPFVLKTSEIVHNFSQKPELNHLFELIKHSL